MPDNDSHQNAPHLQDRLGAAAAGYLPPVTQHEELAAGRLVAHIAVADQGAARRFVHELEHGLGPWVVDPWRLIEALAARLGRPCAVTETEAPDAETGTQPDDVD